MSPALLRIIRTDAPCRRALLCAAAFLAGGTVLLLPVPPWAGAAGPFAAAAAHAAAGLGRNAMTLTLLVAALAGVTVWLRAGVVAGLLTEGERVRGTVLAVVPLRRGIRGLGWRLGRPAGCQVEYRYEVDGERFRGVVHTRGGSLGGVRCGGAVTVCYDPTRPQEAVLAELYEAR